MLEKCLRIAQAYIFFPFFAFLCMLYNLVQLFGALEFTHINYLILNSQNLNFQYMGVPVGYMQQIIVKATVSPWKQEYMVPDDAFRSPLLRVFEILEELEKFKFKDG